MLRRILAAFATPGGSTTAHHRGATWFWHWGLGAWPGAALSGLDWISALGAVAVVGVIYWITKERRDLARGGAWRDGIEDALAVAVGAWAGYAVPAMLWPVLVGHAGALLVMARGMQR